ncbi:MAG: exosortase U [Planctomycetota bacterium]
MSQRFSTTLWLIVAIVGMGFMQWLIRSAEVRLPPGPERGDIRVQQSVLDSDIDGWKQIKFTPAENAEELPDGQFWWSFTWHYQKDDLVAVVAFDQADWHDWHELTECYQALGWKLQNRAVLSNVANAPEGTTVHALFRRTYKAESGVLVFAEFNENGHLLTAPGLSVIRRKLDQQPTAFEKAHNRIAGSRDFGAASKDLTGVKKVMQVQVFLPCNRDLTPEESSSLLALHERCTWSVRQEWLRQVSAVQNPSHHSHSESERPR